MASASSRSSGCPRATGARKSILTADDKSSLSLLLINVKVQHAAVKRSKSLGGASYDRLSDGVCLLYHWLQTHSIEQIERSIR